MYHFEGEKEYEDYMFYGYDQYDDYLLYDEHESETEEGWNNFGEF